jgi:Leucine-rich repeat (LRR) protein
MKKSFLLIFIFSLLLNGCAVTNQPNISNNDSGAPGDKKFTATSQNLLDLSNQGLTKIPENIFKQTNLEELNVSYNNLTGAVQGEIRFLQKLKVLNLSNNQMTGVPAEIGQLANLEVLDLSNNQLTGLPNELGNLKKLKTLNISGNKYSAQDLDIIIKNLPASVNIIK